MHRSIILFVLLATSTVAIAQWSPLPESRTDRTDYFDKASINSQGASVRMVWLTDLPKPEYVRRRTSSKTFSSEIIHAEYNCETKQYRILQATLFVGHMGNGEQFANTTNGPWRDLSDGWEVWRLTWRIACNHI